MKQNSTKLLFILFAIVTYNKQLISMREQHEEQPIKRGHLVQPRSFQHILRFTPQQKEKAILSSTCQNARSGLIFYNRTLNDPSCQPMCITTTSISRTITPASIAATKVLVLQERGAVESEGEGQVEARRPYLYGGTWPSTFYEWFAEQKFTKLNAKFKACPRYPTAKDFYEELFTKLEADYVERRRLIEQGGTLNTLQHLGIDVSISEINDQQLHEVLELLQQKQFYNNLRSLTIDCRYNPINTLDLNNLPQTLRTLTINCNGCPINILDLNNLPQDLRTLTINCSHCPINTLDLINLPPTLQTLTIYCSECPINILDLNNLPQDLRTLTIKCFVCPNLNTLDLNNFLQDLRSLTIDCSWCHINTLNLNNLPQALRTLNIDCSHCPINTLDLINLPQTLRTLTIECFMCPNLNTLDLINLPPTLRTLTIDCSNCPINTLDLRNFPQDLQTLTIICFGCPNLDTTRMLENIPDHFRQDVVL